MKVQYPNLIFVTPMIFSLTQCPWLEKAEIDLEGYHGGKTIFLFFILGWVKGELWNWQGAVKVPSPRSESGEVSVNFRHRYIWCRSHIAFPTPHGYSVLMNASRSHWTFPDSCWWSCGKLVYVERVYFLEEFPPQQWYNCLSVCKGMHIMTTSIWFKRVRTYLW